MKGKLSYWVDNKNIICKVDDCWDSEMDVQSWSERASKNLIVGKNLFDFICDDITRMYIAALIDLVRVVPQTVFRPYRCDTPDTKRYMQMIVSPEPNGWVKISHELLQSEPLLKKVSFKTQVPSVKITSIPKVDSASFVVNHIRCSLCNRINEVGSTLWQEVDTLPDADIQDPLPVVYGVCLDCAKGIYYKKS